MRLYLVDVHYCVLFSNKVKVRIRVRIRLRLSVCSVSWYAHVFVLLYVVLSHCCIRWVSFSVPPCSSSIRRSRSRVKICRCATLQERPPANTLGGPTTASAAGVDLGPPLEYLISNNDPTTGRQLARTCAWHRHRSLPWWTRKVSNSI